MGKISAVGVDLSKNVFHLHAVDARGNLVKRWKANRAKVFASLEGLPAGAVVFVETCQGSHYFSREVARLGYKAKQIPARFVKAFVKSQKNDFGDAEAVTEAGVRPRMRFVPTKSAEQQEIEALHVLRQRLIRQRTAAMNQARGMLAEQGRVLRQGPAALKKYLREELENDALLGSVLKRLLRDVGAELKGMEERIAEQEKQLKGLLASNDIVKRLMTIPGIGFLTASALVVCCGDLRGFKNGRAFAAWLGLVPRQFTTGDKPVLLGISKRGNVYLRTLLVHGGRAVVRYAQAKTDPYNLWVQKLHESKGTMRTAVAVANRNARIAWRIMTSDATFNASYQQ